MSDRYPKNRGIIARRLWSELKATTMSTFFKLCPSSAYSNGGRRSDAEKYLQLNNGSEILWLHLDEMDMSVLRGLEFNWFVVDQAEELPEEVFDVMLSRLGRWDQAIVSPETIEKNGGIDEWEWKNPVTGRPTPPCYAMLTCNPESELHWLYRRFHPDSPEWQERYRQHGYKMFQMDSTQNRYLPVEYVNNLMRQDGTFVRRFVKGEWGIPEGTIHQVSEQSILDLPDPQEFIAHLKRSSTLVRGLDHGDAAPTCCLWAAIDRDKNIFVYREYYMPNQLISDHRRNISSLSRGESYQRSIADPHTFAPTMQSRGLRWSVAEEYGDVRTLPRETAIFWEKGDNDELGTRNSINEYLRVDPERIHPITKQRGAPRLFFIKRNDKYGQGCDHVIRETRSQRRKKIGTELGRPIFSDEREDGTDHSYDALRYIVAAHPPGPGIKELNRRSNRTFAAIRQNYVDRRRLTRFGAAARRSYEGPNYAA